MDKKVFDVLDKLCITDRFPHLEIKGEKAVYTIDDSHEDTSYVDGYDSEILYFPRVDIERLVQDALNSEKRESVKQTKGSLFRHHER